MRRGGNANTNARAAQNVETERNVNKEGKKDNPGLERKTRINNEGEESCTGRTLHGADANENKNAHCNNTVKQQRLMNKPERKKPKIKNKKLKGHRIHRGGEH